MSNCFRIYNIENTHQHEYQQDLYFHVIRYFEMVTLIDNRLVTDTFVCFRMESECLAPISELDFMVLNLVTWMSRSLYTKSQPSPN